MRLEEEIEPDAEDLLFFADETGHETFAGNQGYYGLGGCVVIGAGYPHLIQKWGEVRKIITGSSELPIHASEIARTPENFAALSQFFLDHSFIRIAATITKAASYPDGMHPCVPVMGQIRQEVGIVASAIPCKKLWIIIESSQRADPVVGAALSN